MMRSLLLVRHAEVANFASGADAILAATASAPPPPGCALYLRVRPLDAPGWLDDVAAAARLRPTGVALEGAEGAADVQRLGARLAVEEARLDLPEGALRILAFATATPAGVLALASYAGASSRLAGLLTTPAPRLSGGPLRLARELGVIGARAAGVRIVDAPCDDVEGLHAAALKAREDGFDGMAALSEAQVALINGVFAP